MIGPRREIVPEQQPDDERAAAGTEVELTAAWQRDRDLTDGQTDGDADGEAGSIELVRMSFRIAQRSSDPCQPIGRSDDPDTIAKGELRRVGDHEVDIATAQPRHRHTEPILEVQLAQPLTGEATIGHEHAAEVECAAVEREMTITTCADVPAERRHGRTRADHDERVAGDGHVR